MVVMLMVLVDMDLLLHKSLLFFVKSMMFLFFAFRWREIVGSRLQLLQRQQRHLLELKPLSRHRPARQHPVLTLVHPMLLPPHLRLLYLDQYLLFCPVFPYVSAK
jgi:hypothetical protein